MLIGSLAAPGAAQGPAGTGQPPARPATSFELIDQALKDGRIDEETAHKYRVFAGYGDTRLPAPYRGNDSDLMESPDAVAAAGARLSTFSAATRAELEPFFKRPDEPGSWITLSTVRGGEEIRGPNRAEPPPQFGMGIGLGVQPIQWQKFPAAGGKAKVWAQTRYPGDAAKAAALANELSSKIWGDLNNLMGPDPVDDVGFGNNGGDAALDFYLIRSAFPGDTKSSDPAHPCQPSRYILLDGSIQLIGGPRRQGLRTNAAHELMHAIQFAYQVRGGCAAKWIAEASATWAENFVYQGDNTEHAAAPHYLRLPEAAIDALMLAQPGFPYGAYLLPYFREQTGGGPGFMPTMWNNFRTMSDVDGVNAVLSGGFDQAWPEFLVRNWNRVPVDAPKGYKGWDQLAHAVTVAGGPQSLSSPSGPRKVPIPFPGPGGLQSLAGFFKHFTFDQTVHTVLFTNTVADMAQPHKSVWGIEKINGAWKQPVPWTSDPRKAWCRDFTSEHLEELVIIFGNSDWQTRQRLSPPTAPSLTVSPIGCTAFVGTITTRQTMSDPSSFSVVAIADANVRFEPDPDFAISGSPTEYWRLVSGAITWSANVSGKCTGSASGSIPVRLFGGADDNHMANIRLADDGNGLLYSGGTGPIPDAQSPQVTVNCPGNPPTVLELPVLLSWWVTGPQGHPPSPDGKTLSGTYSMGAPGGSSGATFTWSLRASP